MKRPALPNFTAYRAFFMYKAGLVVLFLFLSATLKAQVFTDPALAFGSAHSGNKPVLLIFQGSDWCIPCIQLEHKVLSQPAFLDVVKDKLIVLKADFPQNKKIEPELEQQYEALAEQFNEEGSFPKMILLDSDKKLVYTFRIDYTTSDELIQDLAKELKQYHAEM